MLRLNYLPGRLIVIGILLKTCKSESMYFSKLFVNESPVEQKIKLSCDDDGDYAEGTKEPT
jgi:hypothetical protein